MDRIQSRFNQIIQKRNIVILASFVIFGVICFNLCDFKEMSSIHQLRKLKKKSIAKQSKTLVDYYFIQNISQYPFFGEWSNLAFEKPNFELDHGEATLIFSFASIDSFSTNQTSTISQLERNQSLDISFLLKDGNYLDNIFRGNTSLQLPIGFYDNISKAIRTQSTLKLVNKNISLTISYGEYFSDCPNDTYNSTDIELAFIPNEQIFTSNIEMASSSFFSNISLKLNSSVRDFEVNIEAMVVNTDYYSVRTLNYSIMLTIIGLIEIYFATRLLIGVSDNIQSGLNLDVITIAIQIMLSSVICSIHFFLALSFEEMSYEYGTPSIVFFILFSIFQMKTLFLSWKCRHNDLFHNDILLFRKKLLQFYSVFYVALFLFLISLRYWYNNFILVYFVFLSTWLFQIIHNAKSGTKPPFTFGYIICISLSKIFLPVSNVIKLIFILDLYQGISK